MNKKGLIVALIIVIVIVIAIGAILFFNPSENEVINEEEIIVNENEESFVIEDSVVTYTDSGFSPNEITIEEGGVVTFVNESSKDMWVASDLHPTHENYSGTSLQEHCSDEGVTSFDACGRFSTGDSWSFTFGQPGEWSYHNHSSASDTGVVIVE
ncbi:MAG: hypothetical protein WDZ80_05855 [Candidatus Paceibacterota bacterium]